MVNNKEIQDLELIKNCKEKKNVEQVISNILESDLYITSEFLNCPTIKGLGNIFLGGEGLFLTTLKAILLDTAHMVVSILRSCVTLYQRRRMVTKNDKCR